jgi:hypothetical protein
MATINTELETIEIKHPVFNDFVVTAKKLQPIEAMDLFSRMQKYQRVVPLTHPTKVDAEGSPIFLTNDDGEIQYAILSNVPAKAVLDVLGEILLGWSGLDDGNKPIPFTPSNFKYLFNKDLNVPITRKVKRKDGSEKEVKGTQSFADYIQAQVNKEAGMESEEVDPN